MKGLKNIVNFFAFLVLILEILFLKNIFSIFEVIFEPFGTFWDLLGPHKKSKNIFLDIFREKAETSSSPDYFREKVETSSSPDYFREKVETSSSPDYLSKVRNLTKNRILINPSSSLLSKNF